MAALAFIAASGAAGAQDTYYIQSGAFPTIGGISVSGFFKTSGVGMDTVTGFDLTLRGHGESITLCSSRTFGCTPNDFLVGDTGVMDTGTALVCAANCLFYDDEVGYTLPSGFLFSGSSTGQGLQAEQYRVGGYKNTAQAAAPKGSFVIAGRVSAPEIDPASAASGLTLLLGSLIVLRGRRSREIESTSV